MGQEENWINLLLEQEMKTGWTIYIAGPMRGFPRFNFDAFDQAERALSEMGMVPISPAAMDREIGFNPDTDEPDRAFLEAAMRRDIDAIMRADAVVMLPGWEKSTGAFAERHLARWGHIPAYSWPNLEPLD